MRHAFVIRAAVMLGLSLALCGTANAAASLAGDLPRRAALGFAAEAGDGGLTVTRVDAQSSAERAGLKSGDRIVAIDGQADSDALDAADRLRRVAANRELRLSLLRDGARVEVRFAVAGQPLEVIPGMDSFYDVADVGGGVRLRTLVATPSGARGRLPALLFTQWVSCGSIEHNEASAWRAGLARFARMHGLALVRVERASDGDSEGPACHKLDYDTEVNHYIAAFDRLLTISPRLDRSRVLVLGSSLGSTTAPLVAIALQQRGHRIAGIAVNGGGAVTYFERMLNFERHYLERRPAAVKPEQIHAQMTARIHFLHEYLIQGRTPDDIARDDARMAGVRADILGLGKNEHYGRSFAWHQQAAKRDFLSAWAGLKARVLVVFGEYDQYEDRHGHELIARMVNRLRPGSARFVELARTDHDLVKHATIENAYSDAPGGVGNHKAFFDAMSAWLKQAMH